MPSTLAHRKAIVLAASRGLGRAIAEAFAAEGADLAICSRSELAISSVAADISRKFGVRAIGRAVDVADAARLTEFIDGAARELSGLDVLVTNAGGPRAGFFSALKPEDWSHAFALNLMSVVHAVRAALPHMTDRPGANLLAVVSSSVKVPIAELVLSNAFRPAIVGLAKTLSLELADRGIRVNCLAPGRIDTERVRELDQVHARSSARTPEEVRRDSERSIPLGRYGSVEEFARAAVFLASDAAQYITGQTLFVDGGMTRTLY